jgi:uncharacterized protein
MMEEYIGSDDCTFRVPADPEEYIRCDDSVFYEHLRRDASHNEWADRILRRKTYKVAMEVHESRGEPSKSAEAVELKAKLKAKGVVFLEASSGKGLSNYVKPNLGANTEVDEQTIFVESFDPLSKESRFQPLEDYTDLFRRYAEKKNIYRIYIPESAKE